MRFLLSSVAVLALVAPATSRPGVDDPLWLGCWSAPGGGEVWLFEAARCGHLPSSGAPRFFRAHYRKGEDEGGARAWLESWARVTELQLALDGDTLRLGRGEREPVLLERLDAVPAELAVPPYDLPDPVPLDAETVAAVQETLAERHAEDQRVRAPGADQGSMHTVDEDNTVFLRSLTHELGWIDATRFGPEASDAAFLIVQHTDDLRLQRTALPFIEADVKAKKLDGQNYALLFDRLQLRLGHRQRYGSQLGMAKGGTVLMPCEDPSRVDELRASLGMGPLAEYLALFERGEEAKPVRRMEEVLPLPPEER